MLHSVRPGKEWSQGVFLFSKQGVFMSREMRRKRQVLPSEECRAVVERGTSGVLALAEDGGYSYTVRLSYVYDGA